MPRPCSICSHAERETIDAELVAGGVFRNIAKRFGTSTTALFRHKDEHIPVALSKAVEAKEVAKADTLLDQVQELRSRAMGILDRAEHADDLRAACGAIREARGCVELLAKLAGELRDGGVSITFNQGADASLLARLIEWLAPYPEVRQHVADCVQNEFGDWELARK